MKKLLLLFLPLMYSCIDVEDSINRLFTPKKNIIQKEEVKQQVKNLEVSQEISYNEIFNTDLNYKGSFQLGYCWYDALGKNTLIISGTDSYIDIESIHPEQREDGILVTNLFAYHYVGSEGNIKLLWDLKDYSSREGYIWMDDVSITDLDNDGIVETCIAYDAKQIKVIMHESEKKYAIRGDIQSAIDDDGEGYNKWNYDMYGRDSFYHANEKFKSHALELWESIADIFTVG